jgi:hypothetical protein
LPSPPDVHTLLTFYIGKESSHSTVYVKISELDL